MSSLVFTSAQALLRDIPDYLDHFRCFLYYGLARRPVPPSFRVHSLIINHMPLSTAGVMVRPHRNSTAQTRR